MALAVVVLLASLSFSAVAHAAGSQIAGTSNYIASTGYVFGPYNETSAGQSLAALVVPERSGTPHRLSLLMTGTGAHPLRIALHSVDGNGRIGGVLASTTIQFDSLGNQHGTYRDVPVSGWPRMEAGQTYAVSAVSFVRATLGNAGWSGATRTPSVTTWVTGSISQGADEPNWYHYGSAIVPGLKIFAPRPTRVTAHGLVADLGSARVNLTPSATLAALEPEEPLGGREIRFYSGNSLLCTATTASDGRAACDVPAPLVNALATAGNYRARFAGDEDYLASSDNGTLVE